MAAFLAMVIVALMPRISVSRGITGKARMDLAFYH
jgi:hypothetical protein